MPRTVKEYRQRWQNALKPESVTAPWDEELTPTSCVIRESTHSALIGDGCSYFADFGDAICFYRYLRIPEELDSAPAEHLDVPALLPDLALKGWSWSRYRARFSVEEIRRRRAQGERALDGLLGRFVREGYRPAMAQRLIDIVNATLIDFQLRDVFVLPGDLEILLERVGNPLARYGSSSDEALAKATAPLFDLNAHGHREALAEHLIEMGH